MSNVNRLKKLTSALDKQKLMAALRQKKAEDAAKAQEREDKGPRKEFYVTGGPMLYVSKLLNKNGTMSSQQMWNEYSKDKAAIADDVLQSHTYLRTKIIKNMILQGKLERQFFSSVKKRFLGYKLVPHKAFRNVDPAILAAITPPVNITPKKAPEAGAPVTVESTKV